jgi:tRNA U55 pseudouridine synthase TruB
MRLQTFEPNVFGLYKPAGWTPLQALLELKRVRPELADIPLTYAGRLDPMAEGLLLVLGGEKVHEKDTYLGLDKTYTVTALLGIETDSFDLLGMPKAAAHTCNKLGSIRKLDSEVGEKDGASEAKVREVLNSSF